MKPHGRVDGILPAFLLITTDVSAKKLLALMAVPGSSQWSLQTGIEAHQDYVPRDRSCTLSSIVYSWHSGLEGHRELEGIESSFAGSVLLESAGCLCARPERDLFAIPQATEVL
jgi:hypothetical protein